MVEEGTIGSALEENVCLPCHSRQPGKRNNWNHTKQGLQRKYPHWISFLNSRKVIISTTFLRSVAAPAAEEL